MDTLRRLVADPQMLVQPAQPGQLTCRSGTTSTICTTGPARTASPTRESSPAMQDNQLNYGKWNLETFSDMILSTKDRLMITNECFSIAIVWSSSCACFLSDVTVGRGPFYDPWCLFTVIIVLKRWNVIVFLLIWFYREGTAWWTPSVYSDYCLKRWNMLVLLVAWFFRRRTVRLLMSVYSDYCLERWNMIVLLVIWFFRQGAVWLLLWVFTVIIV